MKIMKPKFLFTDASLPLFLEAFGFKIDDEGYVTDGKKKIHKSDILGFHKSVGIITK